ncbi:MAG: EAL domain-containing protein [Gemmatimonadales bacterium]|nr:EAL domain-containing protein [Gemmatimonadales bacterium]
MAIGLVALLRCVLLVLRLRDWRIGILGALVLLLLAHTLSEAPSWWSLPVSVLVLASVLVVQRVISDHRRVAAELGRERAHLDQLVENAPEAIVLLDNDDVVQRVNAYFTRMFGYTPEEAVGRRINDLIAPAHLAEEAASLTRRVTEGETVSYETVRQRKDGRLVDVSILGTPIVGPMGRMAVYGIYRDITERKAAEEQLLHLAIRDELTGLANRALFRDLVARSIGRGKRREDYAYAVVVLDIDRFKLVNESLGYSTGDQLLTAIARRLERCVRPGDTAARLGGDEFALFLDDIHDVGDAIRVADRIENELKQPFVLGTQEVFGSASIGIALSVAGYDRPEDFLRDADLAMYRAKEQGGARHEVFQVEMHKHAVAMLQLETDLRRALERDEFLLHYQPIVSMRSGKIVGFEALARWQHPQRGLVQPASFIPVAEQTGMIVPLGLWVLREACRQIKVWQQLAGPEHPLAMSVNLSAKQLLQPDLVDQIALILKETGLDAHTLQLEITESVIVENAESAVSMLARLRALNVQLHMDDFGTGYSSLSYLHRFQIDTLKIDRSFVSNLGLRGENSEIIRTIVTLARNLGIDVIAEGVETEEQLALLRAIGCAHVQGFLFSEPIPGDAAIALLGSARIS